MAAVSRTPVSAEKGEPFIQRFFLWRLLSVTSRNNVCRLAKAILGQSQLRASEVHPIQVSNHA